ncbi:hypothetical protein RCH23_001169 [Cryobacterium sp. CAN_C3]|uniref:hypothetical protein n=1 Tax=unclassified Cryobacterium TaxID=2649013 RepID=UPI0018CB41BA|nr:hypothetical protein [Cryobacterium sp. CAN_C3]MEC5153800.1 hypothetical protein [Cryobacterium sp. CAN_C3]
MSREGARHRRGRHAPPRRRQGRARDFSLIGFKQDFAALTYGQGITLYSFSKQGAEALQIQELPAAVVLPDEAQLIIRVSRDGKQEDWTYPVLRLNVAIEEWWRGIGFLSRNK